ncbi:hypothetical protein AtNW77_Chr3g0200761 [Arabidopsis thaliana]|nr:unnamed protein product [Arabidopsis thaliana]
MYDDEVPIPRKIKNYKVTSFTSGGVVDGDSLRLVLAATVENHRKLSQVGLVSVKTDKGGILTFCFGGGRRGDFLNRMSRFF